MTSDTSSSHWTILKILTWTTSYFESFNIDSPRLTAEILLCHCLEVKRLDLYLQYDRPLDKKELSAYRGLISRRVKREPVAYITGTKGFWESEFSVNQGVLIPRPDTEVLVETALKILGTAGFEKKKNKVLELGVGSGAVIISIAATYPLNFYFAGDLSYGAAESAACNARKILDNTGVSIFVGSWFSCLNVKNRFDLIISNPPYIPLKEIENLQPEIKNYEPMLALDGGEDGLACIREIMGHAWQYLSSKGVLLLETGADQKPHIETIADNCSKYDPVKYIKDYAGHDRVAVLKKRDCQKR